MDKSKNYYIGLDIGTNSIGYAVVNPDYTLCRHNKEGMWGAALFDEGLKCDVRRSMRSARRRLDRRQYRVQLVSELLCNEIVKVDKKFFVKLRESALFYEDREIKDEFSYEWFKREYQNKYKTIHHLLIDMIESDEKFDIRLLYIACAWLVAHRGHFLYDIDAEKIDELTDINPLYKEFEQWFYDNDYEIPWKCDVDKFAEILSENSTVSSKEKKMYELLTGGKKPIEDEERFPVSRFAMIKLLCGGSIKASKLFINSEDYENI